ncbi:LysR family transcriptional regulator [Denitromonas iodatirespirans]|uniref:LysR family transcriptional regulator n=1 Tax=Denitromonas iodatirespirans TaxID=2795389 RepID=A0A944HB03_DENI1|nr:LysR family transcriptional regulator [Denitromonas iodatirespirans]MBT0964015.1 LysR family transcriptional regulator [Denitromonas iodatirespirans]
MSNFDYSNLDGHLLELLIAVVEEGSITRAAERLGVTQSAVSHLLGKLRAIVGDPLFVKSGRGIVATARAESLAIQARVLLEEMRRFATAPDFDPAGLDTTFVIAANDFQCDLLLPALLARLRTVAPGVGLRVIPSGIPSAEMLREAQCHLVISPRPPDAGDVLHKRLFEDRFRVFYDADHRAPPQTRDDYLAADHVTVVYAPHRLLDFDQRLATQGIRRRFVASVPGFAGIPAFLRNSDRLATMPGLLRHHLMREFASVALPFDAPRLPMYLIWHLRDRHDPVHAWLRAEVEAVAQGAVLRQARAATP